MRITISSVNIKSGVLDFDSIVNSTKRNSCIIKRFIKCNDEEYEFHEKEMLQNESNSQKKCTRSFL